MKSKETKESKNKPKVILSIEEIQIRKKYKINLLMCLIYAVIIETYFVSLNLINTSMAIENFNIYVKISYILFILIAIVLFEIAYKKEKKNFAITGVEFVVIALHILLVGKSVTQSNGGKESYILYSSYIWPIYYCFKAMMIHTKENRRKLKQISDISEIVKEEKPTKKVAKKRKK